ncbi:MAG: hypothetical protein RLZ19_353, partial [Actinomycetota bacterium]
MACRVRSIETPTPNADRNTTNSDSHNDAHERAASLIAQWCS